MLLFRPMTSQTTVSTSPFSRVPTSSHWLAGFLQLRTVPFNSSCHFASNCDHSIDWLLYFSDFGWHDWLLTVDN